MQRLEDQAFDVHQTVEAVATDHDIRTHVHKHQPQLIAANTGAHAPELTNHAHDLRVAQAALLKLLKAVAVVSPATFPEQPAGLLHAQAWTAFAEAYGCREPAFFNMSTPSSSS